MSDTAWRRYPLSPRFIVAADGGRAARRVRALAGTSDWRRQLLDRTGSAAIALFGTRFLRAAPRWDWPAVAPDDLADELGARLPGLVIVGVAMPRQTGRTRLSLLCAVDGTDVVVKLGVPDDGLETEARALELLTETPLPGIATPKVLAAGHIGDGALAFLATDALGLDHQRPALDVDLSRFETDLGRCLGALPRPAGTPNDAVAVHGDLAPWNLRRVPQGLALFDWEAAGWGPSGSDVEHYRVARATLQRRR